MTHLAVDLGSTNTISEAILFTPECPQDQRFLRFRTTQADFVEIVQRHGVTHVICESSRPAHWVHAALKQLGVTVLVAGTHTEEFTGPQRRWKDDRRDALRLMRLFLDGRLRFITLRSERARDQQAALEERRSVVEELIAYKSQVRSLLDTVGIVCPKGSTAWSQKGLAVLRGWCDEAPAGVEPGWWQRRLRRLLDRIATRQAEVRDCDREIKRLCQSDAYARQLQTIPSIGPLNAVSMAASIDRPERFAHSKQVSAYSGFNPAPYTSGKRVGTIGISRGSSPLMRSYLFEACSIAVHRLKEPWFCRIYERLLSTGKPRKKVLCALARRLYVKCWLMLKTGQSWEELTAPRAATPDAV